MATLEKYHKSESTLRINRYFSEDFKRKKVREVESRVTTIRELSREYSVSETAIYKWIYKYSGMRKKGIKMVVEAKSDTRKIQQLKEMLKEAETAVGQKQIMIDFLEKMIELAEQEYGVEIKKKFSLGRSNGFGSIVKRTRSK
jgi:transposase